MSISVKPIYEPRDHLASFDLSIELLQQMLKLPEGTTIQRFFPSNRVTGAITIVVTHPDFPMVYWGDWIPEIYPFVSLVDGRLVFERWDSLEERKRE